MLTKVPQFAIMYRAQSRQQAAPSERPQTAKARPVKGSGQKQETTTPTEKVGMETVHEEDDEYVVV